MGVPEGHNLGLGVDFILDDAAIARQRLYDGFGNAVTEEAQLAEVPIDYSESAAKTLTEGQISVGALIEKAHKIAATLPPDAGLREAMRVCERVDPPLPIPYKPIRSEFFRSGWPDRLPDDYRSDGTRPPDNKTDDTSTQQHHKGEQ
jgi:hypothetical protein